MSSARPPAERRAEQKSVPEVLGELKDLVVAYARQELVDPVKGLKRFLAFGVPGSLLLGVGVVLLVLGGLRALQTQTGTTFTGNLSWLPYLIAFAGLVVLAALAAAAVTRKPKEARR